MADAFRRKIFFNYEKRLRLQSPPEKVFIIFCKHAVSFAAHNLTSFKRAIILSFFGIGFSFQ